MLLTKPDTHNKPIAAHASSNLVFGRRQFMPLLLGLVVIAMGFSCMASDPTPQGYGFLGLTLGPLLVVLGLLLPFLGIFRRNRPKADDQSLPDQQPKENDSWRLFHRWNLALGWRVAAVALTVYVLTLEPSTSFWDTGEFIAAAYKLQVPHPPGAPLFLLIGRLFTLLSFGDVTKVAWCMNLLSALSSAGTVLFLFWSITLLARRLLSISSEGPTKAQRVLLLGSATVGALGFAFTDSFWFSAVEAEVYALSSFFTAIVFWAALRWQAKAHTPDADRWLLFLAYLVGLSIGVHLLNLVAIPAIALLVYMERNKPTKRGILLSLVIGGAIVLGVMEGVITGLPTLAGTFEVFFVNTFGLPYGSGAVLFLLALVVGLVYGLRWAKQHGKAILHTSLVAFILILTGYSSYLMVPIRSGYNTPIDENNPENLLSFVSYLKREQYGSRPLLYGPQFNAQGQSYDKTGEIFAPKNGHYEAVDIKFETRYLAQDKVLLPRLYSPEPAHLRAYQQWVNVENGQKPSFGQNLSFLWNYQLNHMYWRYFGWNFVGREHDTQHAGVLWPWKQQHDVPAPLSTSKARNQFYLLPLLLGVFGLFFQFKRKNADAWTLLLLFFFTGVAIVLYLNQPPVEPRERDYTFAGSYYAFSIWMGLGVLAIAEGLRRILRSEILSAVVAILLALSVPAVLLAKGWDDHDRSGRSHALDNARNLLSSVAPNAILFTNGDNDTFPLWYAQEVEGYRTDVRVLVLPYLNTDWYIEQLKKPMNASQPLVTTLGMPQYAYSNNNYLPYVANPTVQESGMDLRQYLSLLQENHPALQVQTQDGRTLNTLPTKKLQLPINAQAVAHNQTVSPSRAGQVASRMEWELQTEALEKKHLVILDILASNNWQRPVYFSTSGGETSELGLQPFLQLEGMALRVVPARNPNPKAEAYIDLDRTYQSLMQTFRYTGLQNPDNVYEENFTTQVVPIYRRNFAELATAYLQNNEPAKARAVLQKCLTSLPDQGAPHNFESASLVFPLANAGMLTEAQALTNLLSRRFDQLLTYYSTQPSYYDRERQLNLYGLQLLTQAAYSLNLPQAKQLEALFNKHYGLINN
jgi:hypothetical protein